MKKKQTVKTNKNKSILSSSVGKFSVIVIQKNGVIRATPRKYKKYKSKL